MKVFLIATVALCLFFAARESIGQDQGPSERKFGLGARYFF